MHMRNISHVTQHAARFYAQNVSLIPLYNKIFVDGRPRMRPEGYDGDTCIMDPDLPIYWKNWVEHNARVEIEVYEMENWVRMGGNSFISWTEWKHLSPFEREGLKIIKNQVTKEINKEVQQKEADLAQKMEAAKPHVSPFANTPATPSFIK